MIYGNQIEYSYSDDNKKEYSDAYRKEVSKRGKNARLFCSLINGQIIVGDVFVPNGLRTSDYIASTRMIILNDVFINGEEMHGVHVVIVSNCLYINIED